MKRKKGQEITKKITEENAPFFHFGFWHNEIMYQYGALPGSEAKVWDKLCELGVFKSEADNSSFEAK